MSGQNDFLNLINSIIDTWMQNDSRFTSGLGMKLGREAYLEQNIFHHVATKLALEGKTALTFRFECQIFIGMAKQDIIKAPLRSG